ncbi:hypothetical protein [Amycolatopsis sp. CA-126428]|uniref:hypothetical protein n=1 Tax=Amycolatopsis sp. CA-126428 TaxID=2073158 RepID=UPI000CD167CA|nr:hypothetical protein [Amycolatopsis sp. CA-126428]
MTQRSRPSGGSEPVGFDVERRRELRKIGTVVFVGGVRKLHEMVAPVLVTGDDHVDHQGLQLLWADIITDRRQLPDERLMRSRQLPGWMRLNPRDDDASTSAELWSREVMQLVRELGRFALSSAYDYSTVYSTVCELESGYAAILRRLFR